ncbi:hypothetical protein B7P43_G07383 [Cryptotermes secundus]|uniref:Nucleolus and neural progenitor protein-like N-terminal domain-containing protein n=1 Tax=Cryptotermes secundus TaxID=105785 RepID=A0A2J7PN06_9NEOP|nr:uncharacterized protein LOC111872902 isoform X2 [Cryptotermes secundus]PNF17720.1 hypothetical protein B7P43_G07383 [Cryptotermes secundus]
MKSGCHMLVNRGLLCYLSMDLAMVLNTIKPSPSDNGYDTMCAPSRQMLEWVLVRIQGFARLFCQLMQLCQDAAFYMKCRLHLGHMWDVALISLGIVSRIWAISKYLVLCACEWYRKLKPYLDILEPVGLCWLPCGYHFPSDLRVWLDAPLLTDPPKPKRSSNSNKKQHKIFDLIDLGNSEDEEVMESSNDNEMEVLQSNGTVISSENNTVKFSTDEKEQGKALSKQMKHFEETENVINNNYTNNLFPPKKDLISMIEDVGEPVSSLSLPPGFLFTTALSVEKPKSSKKKERGTQCPKLSLNQQVKCIKTAHDLSKFLSKELKLRKKRSSGSLTSSLDKLQWHMLHKVLSEIICKLNSKSVVKGSDKYKKIIKRARKEILVRTE